jgi:hypothetical protein
MRYLRGHLGITVSALLDGQLDASSAERAWTHVHGCESCRRQVEREGWVKTQLAAMTGDDGPPPQLLGALYGLGFGPTADPRAGADARAAAHAWAAVGELERRSSVRRRTGLAVAGAGSVSLAVLGLASLTGATLGIGGVPAGSPTPAVSRTPSGATPAVVAPLARVHGDLRLDIRQGTPSNRPTGASRGGEGADGLQP